MPLFAPTRTLTGAGLRDGDIRAPLVRLAKGMSACSDAPVRVAWKERAAVPITEVTATHLYRIAQEAAANAVKHARARSITIDVSRTSASTRLRIADDGVGFSAPVSESGLGLRLMKYRAGIIGAELAVTSQLNKGTTVACSLIHRIPRKPRRAPGRRTANPAGGSR